MKWITLKFSNIYGPFFSVIVLQTKQSINGHVALFLSITSHIWPRAFSNFDSLSFH